MSDDQNHRPSTLVTEHGTTRKAVTAAAIGNATEWYDFGVYSYLAVTIGLVFYPSQSQGVQLIATFTTFAAAFLVRPLGGLFFGPLGDRVGRKKVLAFTMLLMAVGTFSIGLIPSAATIGIAAPILLLVARMVQGFSTGGEYGGATTFIAEYAPDRRRGFLASWLEFGTVSGYVGGASIVTVMTLLLGPDAMTAWGWRVPFLLALPLGAVGLYLRLKLEETPVFAQDTEGFGKDTAGRRREGQFRETVVGQWHALLLCVGLVMVFNVNNYMVTAYLPTYLNAELGYSSALGLVMTLTAMAFMLVAVTFFGRLSDRVGRRPVLLSGCLFSIALSLPAFWLLQRGSLVAVALGVLVMAVTLVHFSGSAPAALPALFPTKVRYGALAIGFNVSVALFGGTTPLIAESLVQSTGNLYSPAWLVMIAGAVGLVVVWWMKESAGQPLPGAPHIPVPDRHPGLATRLPYPRRDGDGAPFVRPSNVRRLPSDG
ncbi:MHS family proline/betaine transporter-like MFS transporter [Nocardiopsis sp. Huas11]|uniref:MFS transporter n=1 Tax=Nocardiopsis sp. Huas11 TaxID=2183912 RepID=UPI000EAC9B83|nr:MFS transporter [Nocardiopsis sp. Huas11]RKS09735.1 MHS family proline/betaine transporter-like MFS transporter [Nocardiopsis sp. Huas11]